MICCINCFKDKDIKSRIESLEAIGDCEICGSKNAFIYNTDYDNILTDAFDGLLDIYKPAILLPDEYPKGKLKYMKDELYTNWNIFSIDKDKIDCILKSICSEKYSFTPETSAVYKS